MDSIIPAAHSLPLRVVFSVTILGNSLSTSDALLVDMGAGDCTTPSQGPTLLPTASLSSASSLLFTVHGLAEDSPSAQVGLCLRLWERGSAGAFVLVETRPAVAMFELAATTSQFPVINDLPWSFTVEGFGLSSSSRIVMMEAQDSSSCQKLSEPSPILWEPTTPLTPTVQGVQITFPALGTPQQEVDKLYTFCLEYTPGHWVGFLRPGKNLITPAADGPHPFPCSLWPSCQFHPS